MLKLLESLCDEAIEHMIDAKAEDLPLRRERIRILRWIQHILVRADLPQPSKE